MCLLRVGTSAVGLRPCLFGLRPRPLSLRPRPLSLRARLLSSRLRLLGLGPRPVDLVAQLVPFVEGVELDPAQSQTQPVGLIALVSPRAQIRVAGRRFVAGLPVQLGEALPGLIPPGHVHGDV
ncbi:hypothetical protein ABT369_48535 [Dactylosporangium sp. NPDC000244]|uniref:hypothetical protein n=1 Tax=Dactylosporangium sp. NPDC000244 TaxID=3154365 RepID=UPI0033322F7F